MLREAHILPPSVRSAHKHQRSPVRNLPSQRHSRRTGLLGPERGRVQASLRPGHDMESRSTVAQEPLLHVLGGATRDRQSCALFGEGALLRRY